MREKYITKLAEQYIHMMTDIGGGMQRVFDRRTGEQCGVRVVKPISRTPCVLNATFGCHASRQMWVNHGCRATFALNQQSLACTGVRLHRRSDAHRLSQRRRSS